MTRNNEGVTLWSLIDQYFSADKGNSRLADVFRFISFGVGESYGPHSHMRIEINYVKRGSCRLVLAGGEIVAFAEGEMMIITPEVNHRFEAGDEGATLMQLEFRPEIFNALGASGVLFDHDNDTSALFGDQPGVIKIVDNVRIMRTVQQILVELDDKALGYQPMVIMLYAELLILIKRHISDNYLCRHPNSVLRQSVVYLRSHYQEEISISDVAQMCGVSSRYLRCIFAKHIGKSPLQYLNELRIASAAELISNTDLSIKEVCFRCGFHSPQYFSRIFKQITGRSPRKKV